MHDAEVRTALHARLRVTHARKLSDTRIVDELGISGVARVDTAVLNGSFSGYEIKSERDRLTRLPRQITAYSSVLDYCYLVTTDRHLAHAEPLLPPWWGVITVRQGNGAISLRKTRAARVNPEIDRWQLVRLLWRDETLLALRERGLAHGVTSRPNTVLWDRLAASTSTLALRRLVRETLKARSGWRADVPRPEGVAG